MTGGLRFLHLTTFYPPYSFGGDATYLYRLCHALADEGHDVDVVHSVDAYNLLHPAAPEIAFAPHPGVTVHALDTGHRVLTPLITHQTGSPGLNASAIRHLMASKPYDVVHYHNISLLGPRVLEYPTASRSTIKLYTTHEHWLICPTHVLWKFNERACERPQCLQCTVAAGRPPQWWRYAGVLEASARHVDRFVSPSRFTAAMHRDRGFSEPVGHLPYFVDRSDDDWKTPGNSPHPRPYFLFVGRLERIKGLQTILPLWDSIPEYDLVIAGTGTMESVLRERASGNPRVHFLGPQSQRALGRLYAHAVASIVPSLTYETFGIVILESFARRTPVIVRRLGALPEVVEESGGGLTFASDDELVAAVRRIGGSPTCRRALGDAGYDALLRHWTRDAHLKKYYDLIASVRADRDMHPDAGFAVGNDLRLEEPSVAPVPAPR